MKEIEMRARIERLLGAVVRKATLPVSVGLALTLAGCSSDDSAVSLYSAPVPDAGDESSPVVRYMAQLPDASDASVDQGAVAVYSAPLPEASADVGANPHYAAPLPDAATTDAGAGSASDARSEAAARDGGGAVALYMAQLPDAAAEAAKDAESEADAHWARYAAPLPEGGVMKYMSPLPGDAG